MLRKSGAIDSSAAVGHAPRALAGTTRTRSEQYRHLWQTLREGVFSQASRSVTLTMLKTMRR